MVYLVGEDLVGCAILLVVVKEEFGGRTSKLSVAARGASEWSWPGIATFWKRGIAQWHKLADVESCRGCEDYDKHKISVIERMSSLREVWARRV